MSDSEIPARHLETNVLHGDRIFNTDSSVAPPITYTTTFKAEDAEEFAVMASEAMHQRYYTRYGNPLHQRVASIISVLEGGEDGLVTGSGMGAISTAVLANIKAGEHVIAQKNHYMSTSKLVDEFLPRFGIETTVVDQTSTSAFADAIKHNTKLLLIETPANPTLTITDIKAITDIARAHGIVTIADNTFATPINQQPLSLGVDIVCHSATKYLGGHHDLTSGIIISTKKMIESIWHSFIILGSVCSPMDAWLLLRGLRTLPLRVARQNSTTLEVAKFLQKHPKVEQVFYPGLENHPQYAIAKKQMKEFGGVLAVAIRGGYKETERFVSALKLPINAVSLGGVKSLIVHAAAMWAGTMSDEQMKAANIAPNLVRISIGLEHPQDLMEDLDSALKTV